MLFKTFFAFPLKFRLIALSLVTLIFALFVWIYVSFKWLNDDVSVLISNTQQDSVQQLARHIDDDLNDRLRGLEAVALKLASSMQTGKGQTQHILDEMPLIAPLFNGGVVAYNLQGVQVAVLAPAVAQNNVNAYPIDYVVAALQQGKSSIGPPEFDIQIQKPVFGMAVPVQDSNKRIVGALQGLTILNQPNFLNRSMQRSSQSEDDLLLVDPVRRLVVAASKQERVYTQIPLRGVNTELDTLFMILNIQHPLVQSASVLSQEDANIIQRTGWVLLSGSSSQWALNHLKSKQNINWFALLLLIATGIGVVVWIFKRQLLPIHGATVKLANQIKYKKRWIQQDPTLPQHEMHEIIGGVNQLLSMLGQDDAELPQVDYFAKSLADNMPDVVGYWTSDLHCTYANQGYLQWFGYTPEQMQGMHIKTLMGDKLYASNAPYIQAVLNGENQQFERQVVQRNGKKRDAWVQFMAHKVQDQVQGFFVFMVDITQVKTREHVARISDAALRSISQGIIITDAKHRILLTNKAFTDITGYDKHEAIHKDCGFLLGELSDPLVKESMEKAMAEGVSFSGELVNYRKDGTTFWNDMTISPVHDDFGQLTHFTVVVRDITTRKHMEAERLRAKMQLERDSLNQSILNSLPIDLAVINAQGVVLALNHPQQAFVADPMFPSVEGGSFLELLGRTQDTFLNTYREQAVHGVRSVLERHAEHFAIDYPMDATVNPHWSSMTVTPLGPDLQGAIVARRDITDLRQAYQEMHQATAVAEKANHAKSHFLATASHDLRQPLSALALYVGVLTKRAEPQQKELVDNIRGCVDSLSELLKDLLDVSKLDAGVVKKQLSDFAVDDLLASHMAIQSVNASMKGLKLRMRPSGAMVRTDPKLLSRIVGNLITNAIRYTHQGGVLLACRKHGNSWWLEVWDTGEGIPEDKHSVIFEEFQQLNQTGRTRGSGLGLAIVSKMAHLLGLAIHLRSRPGRGSVFAIELPAAQDPQPNEPIRVSQNKIPRPLRMAVVDDDSRVLRAMVMALEGEGHDVVAADDAAKVVVQLQDHAPDIIISDYRLAQGRTGFEAVAAVRKKFGKDDLPAILVTGDTDPALIRSMADQGIAVHYKPLQLDTLQAFIKESVERRLL